ncbi:MAG: Riboflavin biosynthesis protein RibF [Firmicutes bacterium ADurb.Bin146]|jgi:riboflavin kinase/FMN adenylyltransferase|nr:MAG: Riboflavin biosynthesis protein RibF [Firmicutes bacterium ADurb.Bin146]
MKIISSEDRYKFASKNAIALGNFDGLHIAHKKLILNTVKLAKENNLKSLVYIFDIHPVSLINTTPPRLIIDFEQKLEIIRNLGVDYIFLQKFDIPFSMMKPEDFLINILKVKLSCAYAICGFDYKFGYKAKGDVNLLKDICEKNNICVEILDRMDYLDEPVSASRIRNLLSKGDIQNVNNLLGRKYQIRGVVIKGRSIGSKLGFPTANIIINEDMQIPAFGVYQTVTIVDGTSYKSITNIGSNPTISDNTIFKVTCETHLIDISDINLYNKKIYINFIRMIRKEKKFESLEMLRNAISNDVLLVKSYDE